MLAFSTGPELRKQYKMYGYFTIVMAKIGLVFHVTDCLYDLLAKLSGVFCRIAVRHVRAMKACYIINLSRACHQPSQVHPPLDACPLLDSLGSWTFQIWVVLEIRPRSKRLRNGAGHAELCGRARPTANGALRSSWKVIFPNSS
jgi:hypothetical protein